MLGPIIRNILMIPTILICGATANAQDFSYLVMEIRGAKIVAQDDKNTFLGTLESSYDSNSIFNKYGHSALRSSFSVFIYLHQSHY